MGNFPANFCVKVYGTSGDLKELYKRNSKVTPVEKGSI